MLKIRCLRTGKKNQPFYRIVVTDKKNPPRGGRFLEILGFINPLTKEKQVKAERIKYWLGVGAQPSDRVHNLLVAEKIIEAKKKPVHAKKKEKKEEGTEPSTEAPAPAEKPVEAPAEKPAETPAPAEEPKPEPKEKPAEKPAEK